MRRRPQPSLAEMDVLRVTLKAERREIERLRAALETARQAIQYSIDMGGTDPAGVLIQALNKCDAALSIQQGQNTAEGKP